jgi:hypothetical protein
MEPPKPNQPETDDWLYEMLVTDGRCEVLSLVVGFQELNHILERVHRNPDLEVLAVHCIEKQLAYFLKGCYRMDAVIEG